MIVSSFSSVNFTGLFSSNDLRAATHVRSASFSVRGRCHTGNACSPIRNNTRASNGTRQ
jgi:hypothetical protein